jgi:23S rRNA (cytidine1920-2'-O)/16S rRNA (cytidine1409-2'-O)-methyltransferase
MESFNARKLTPTHLGEAVDLAVTDVSFISQTLLHAPIASILKDGGIFISLIKPQFEVGRENLGKGGIVKNPKARREAARRVMASAHSAGLSPIAITVSPIAGGDGNIEYLAYFRKQKELSIIPTVDHLP